MSEMNLGKPHEATYVKYDGRETTVRITDRALIGSGVFGDVFLADVDISGATRQFAVKRFRGDNDPVPGAEAAQAMRNYKRLKKLGLKVFPTYRMEKDGNSVLITNGYTESTRLLSNMRLTDYGLPKIQNIDPNSYINLWEQMTSQAVKAAEHGLVLPSDSYLYTYNIRNGKIDFIIGDLDYVFQSPLPADTTRINNLSNVLFSIIGFADDNIDCDSNAFYDFFTEKTKNLIDGNGVNAPSA